jgi:hypothetical protein
VIKPSGVQRAVGDIDAHVANAIRGDASAPPDAKTAAWNPPGTVPPATPVSRYARKMREKRIRASWRAKAYEDLSAKPFREKLSELLGSMLMSAIYAALAALVAPVVLGLTTNSASVATYLWLAIVGTLGSWAVIIPTKFTEGKLEDQGPMRIMLLAFGGLVGVAAWALAGAMLVQVPGGSEPLDANWGFVSHEMLEWSLPARGASPSLAMFVTYFAFLFVVLRWWRQAEFTRNQRLSLWAVAACVFWAWLMQFFWQFPQPAGMLVAGVTAFATQLASPWLPPSRRRALAGEVDQTA